MVREQFGNPAALSGWRPGGPACNEQGRVTKIILRSLDVTSDLMFVPSSVLNFSW